VPTVGQVVAVVDAQLGSGLLRCLGPGCEGRLTRWGFGVERDLVGLGGVTGRVRPRRALCAGCGLSRVLLPDSMLRRRQYGVETSDAVKLSSCVANFLPDDREGGGFVVVLAGVQALPDASEQAAEQVPLGGGVPVAVVTAPVVVGAGAG
jgi:hypothetical protein